MSEKFSLTARWNLPDKQDLRTRVGFQKLLVHSLIYVIGLVPESLLPKITSGLARWLFFFKTEAALVALINIKIFDPKLSEKAVKDMCLSSLSNSLTLIYELSKIRFIAFGLRGMDTRY